VADLDFKIIDLGSSFAFSRINEHSQVTTPEYLPPELLNYLDSKNASVLTDLTQMVKPWSIDVWSLGAILIETVTGFPLWLSYKGRISSTHQAASNVMPGLFGV
jgi:serine/threonine protein kinase